MSNIKWNLFDTKWYKDVNWLVLLIGIGSFFILYNKSDDFSYIVNIGLYLLGVVGTIGAFRKFL